MSRHSYTQNYGVPSNTHPPHAGANSSNVINRQTANTNKFDKAPPQTNSNKYEQQNQPQIALANVSSQQQQQQLQQQKNKLVSSDYTIQVPPGSHQQHVTIPHSNFRLPHANNNYHVTPPSVNYSQSVPPQPPTAHTTTDRQSVQIGQQNQQTSQQSQDHKMQPQQQPSQQQFHTSHSYPMVRGQGQRIPTQPTRMNSMVVNRQQQQNQQMAQTHQTAVPSQAGLIYVTHPQVFAYNNSNANFFQHKNTGVPQNYYHQQFYMPTIPSPISQRTGATNPQHMPAMNAGVSAGGSSQIPSHQQAPHQLSQLHITQGGVTSYVPALQQRSQQTTETVQAKRISKRIPIINPNTNEEVLTDSKVSIQHSSGSAALKIEAPTSQIPNQSQQQNQKSSNEPTCDTSNEPEQSSDHSNVEVSMETSSTEEPPHTPVVSAIADGPSVDIMPKQSKNVKRTNKSSEWPTPSAEKTNTESSTRDNYSNVASVGNSSSSTSNEWVKNNQAAPKVSNESEHKDSQQKHNPKSKHSAPNHNIALSSNKGKAAAQTTDAPTNMVANVQQPAPAKEQPQSEPKPVVPVAVQLEQTKADNTNSARSNEKTKQPPQQVDKVHSEEIVTKSNKEKVTESTMSNSSSVSVPTEVADVKTTTKTTKTNTSIDETDKLINSLDSMSISNKEINAEKNDKLDAKSVEFNNNSQKAVTSKTEVPTKNVEPAKTVETIATTVVEQPQQPQPQQQQHQQSSNNQQVSATPNNESQTDLRISENDSRASDKLETTSNTPAAATNNDGLVETIINNNLANTISANNNTNQLNNNAVDKDSDNNVVNSATEDTGSEKPQEVTRPPQQQQQQPSQQPTAAVSTPQQQPTGTQPAAVVPKPKLLLNYEEGQWSPDNTDGKKCYNRQQIMSLRDADASQSLPLIQDSFSLIRKNSPSNGNNNKNQSSSNSRNQYGKRPSTQGGAGGNQQMSQGGGKGSKSGLIHVSLSLREDVKLNESATPWKPSFIGGGKETTNIIVDPNNIDVLCKRVRGILNKLTPEKFEPLLEQLQALNLDTNEKLSSVISLVFEKAIDEPNFSQAYAQLCQKLSKPMEDKEREENEQKQAGDKSNKDTKTAVFKKELLNKCQTEFNTHVANENAIREKLKPIQTELNETADQNRKMELTMMLEEEERKLRRRSVGTVRFIGELYRQNMLLTSIMEWCVMILLNIRTEEKLECLCKLLTTVGQKMEYKSGDDEFDKKYYRDLTPHFQTMQQIATEKKQSKISSRVRFMLMDVIELRKNKWVPRRSDSNPKKMGQIQKEVMEEQYNAKIQLLASAIPSSGMGNNNMRKENRGDRNDRGNMQRGGSMSGSGYNNSNKLSRGNYQDNDGWIQTGGNKNRGGNNSTSFDPSKFRSTSKIEDITTTSLGTPNQFQWKLNTAPPATTSLTNSFSALESDYKPMSGNRSKEPYHSKGSMERERDGPHSRSGSQHGSRDNSAARNSYSSRSLQMRPPQMQYNTLPLNSTSSSSSSQRGIRSDNKLNHQSLSSSTTSLSTSNLPSSSSLTPSSSDPKLSEDISEKTEKIIGSTLKNLLTKVQKNEIIDYSDLSEAPQLDKINRNARWALVRDLHNNAVDISGLTEEKRCFIGTICTYWLNNGQITKQDYVKGLSEYITLLADIVIDVPKIYEWTAQMISVAFFNNIITLNDLKNTVEGSRAKILGSLLPFMAYEYGPQYLRDLWKRSDCKWEQFVADGSDIAKFVEQNKLKFVVDPEESLPPASNKIPNDRFRQRIYQLVRKEKDFSEKEVAEYIKIHVPTINKQSIRLLTKTLIEATLNKTKAGYSLDEKILPNSIDILKGYIAGEQKQDLQLESLYAIQLLSNELEHPSGFLIKVFTKLYDDEVIPGGVIKQWETSTSEPLGKGVAVKNLTQFLKFVEGDLFDSDEESAK